MKTLFSSLALIVLCLPACSTQPARDASPASDLTALRTNAERALAPRYLPNGKRYCYELAKTERAQDDCALDLEDMAYLSEQDKARGLDLVRKATTRLELARTSCRWYMLRCKGQRAAHQRGLDDPGYKP